MNIIYKSPIDYKSKVLNFEAQDWSLDKLKRCILLNEHLDDTLCDIKLYYNGKFLESIFDNTYHNDKYLQVVIPINGGKGGFGSMLRAIGAQIEKTTNREACRDLSGRRLRDVNEEKRIKEWIKKQAQRKEEATKVKKDKLKRLAAMTVPSTKEYTDTEFERTRADIPDIVEDSINYGLQQSSSKQLETGIKRKSNEIDSTSASDVVDTKESKCNGSKFMKNNQNLWLGVDLNSDDDDSDSADESNIIDNVKNKVMS